MATASRRSLIMKLSITASRVISSTRRKGTSNISSTIPRKTSHDPLLPSTPPLCSGFHCARLLRNRGARPDAEDPHLALQQEQHEHDLLRRAGQRLSQGRRTRGRVHPDQSAPRRDGGRSEE